MLDERLLDAIYASTLDDGALQQALRGLARATRSRCAGVFRLGTNGIDWQQAHGMPEGFMERFSQHTPNDPRVAYALAQPPLTLLDDSLPSTRLAMRGSGTDALARHWDLPWTLAVVCARDAKGVWSLYLSRSTREGPAGRTTTDCFEAYAPHFARALQLRVQMRGRLQNWRCSTHGDATRVARLVIDAEARLRSMDAAAETLLRDADGITVRHGRLMLSSAPACSRLHQMAAYLADTPRVEHYAGHFHLPQRNPPGMLKLRMDTSPRTNIAGKRLLAVWLERSDGPITRRLGDNGEQPTPRQLEVLQRLERGMSTAEIAVNLGTSEATVRTHIKHLLALTATHNRRACIAAARERGWV